MISTMGSHVKRALQFYNDGTVYFAIGKSTQWNPEDTPIAEDAATQDLLEVIGFKKVEIKYLVVPDDINGTIVYRSGKWRIITPATATKAQQEGARWVYIQSTLLYDELPLSDYRQIGVYSDVQLVGGVSPSKYALLPSEVSNNGILEAYTNRAKASRAIDQKDAITLILEF